MRHDAKVWTLFAGMVVVYLICLLGFLVGVMFLVKWVFEL